MPLRPVVKLLNLREAGFQPFRDFPWAAILRTIGSLAFEKSCRLAGKIPSGFIPSLNAIGTERPDPCVWGCGITGCYTAAARLSTARMFIKMAGGRSHVERPAHFRIVQQLPERLPQHGTGSQPLAQSDGGGSVDVDRHKLRALHRSADFVAQDQRRGLEL